MSVWVQRIRRLGSCKNHYMWNPSKCGSEFNKACKIDEYLDIKNCSCKRHLNDKLVWGCKDETLNTTETLLKDEKVACSESNCLIHTISFVIIWLLLLVAICSSCYFYNIKYQSKRPFHDINIKLGEI